jgi:hypothetical protein
MDEDAITRAEEAWLNRFSESEPEDKEDDGDEAYDAWVDDQLSWGEDYK